MSDWSHNVSEIRLNVEQNACQLRRSRKILWAGPCNCCYQWLTLVFETLLQLIRLNTCTDKFEFIIIRKRDYFTTCVKRCKYRAIQYLVFDFYILLIGKIDRTTQKYILFFFQHIASFMCKKEGWVKSSDSLGHLRYLRNVKQVFLVFFQYDIVLTCENFSRAQSNSLFFLSKIFHFFRVSHQNYAEELDGSKRLIISNT